jgi:hypothetical protein
MRRLLLRKARQHPYSRKPFSSLNDDKDEGKSQIILHLIALPTYGSIHFPLDSPVEDLVLTEELIFV